MFLLKKQKSLLKKRKSEEMKLEDMSWDEAKEKCAGKIILVPHGSIEQHGYHLPLKTDALVAEKVCETFYDSEDIVVAPVMKYTGVSGGKQKPGTVGFEDKEHIKHLETIIDDYLKLKPKKVVFYLGHEWGRSHELLKPLKEKYGNKWGYTCFLGRLAAKQGMIGNSYHAGEGETSLMLFLDPEHVKMNKAVNENWPRNWREVGISESGTGGDPTNATAEKGKKLFEFYVQKLKEELMK